MMIVTCGDVMYFSPNAGVVLRESALELDPQALHDLIAGAFQRNRNRYFMDLVCGGIPGPFRGEPSMISVERFDEIVAQADASDGYWPNVPARPRTALERRRERFERKRERLIHAMLEAGTEYACAEPGCGEIAELTVDHIHPLSRGGSDDLANLQFLCRSHNCSKGARVPTS